MKVLLSGATAGTNFGDFLFAKMFQRHVADIVGEENVFWNDKGYRTFSEFYAQRLNYKGRFKLKDIDALVYISGGYFCGDDRCWKDYLFRYLHYFHIGVLCLLRRKPYAIIAVEAARSSSFIIDSIQRLLIKKAEIVVVRNQPSMDYVESVIGKENRRVFCTADSVFAMKRSLFEDCLIPEDIENSPYPKLFLHCNPTISQNKRHFDTIVPIVNKFLERHPDYQVIVSADQYAQDFSHELGVGNIVKSMIHSDKTIVYQYDNPIELCKVIDACDVIITSKLHVGIVGAHLGKSVISFSSHTKKIARLYEQLGASDRTIPLSELTIEDGYTLLESKYHVGMHVSQDIILSANSNFSHLTNFLEKYNKTLV